MPPELQAIAARGFMVVMQDFQDPWTLDVGKLRKCCVSEIVPDGRLIPFCAYNSVGYREQVRGAAGMSIGFPEFSSLDLDGDPKGCCARLYESDAARWLLDGELHPGGERLTLRLAELAAIAPGERVLDVACGTGATALLLARESGRMRSASTWAPDDQRAQREARAAGSGRPCALRARRR